MNLAIIPARGGSKRIPRKNIKLFCGKPIISYSIDCLKKTNLFDRIIVSTDDKKIADISIEFGAEIPFMRPRKLADDYTTTIDVIKHAIQWFNEKDKIFNNVCCLYPTAPFVRPKYLLDGYHLLQSTDISFVFPVATFPSSIFRALKRTEDNRLKMIWPEHINTRTQDLPETYHDAGQFYWGEANAFIRNNAIIKEQSSPIIIPRYLAQDIDTKEDWEQAELLFKALHP